MARPVEGDRGDDARTTVKATLSIHSAFSMMFSSVVTSPDLRIKADPMRQAGGDSGLSLRFGGAAGFPILLANVGLSNRRFASPRPTHRDRRSSNQTSNAAPCKGRVLTTRKVLDDLVHRIIRSWSWRTNHSFRNAVRRLRSYLSGGPSKPTGECLDAVLVARQRIEQEAIGKSAQLWTGDLPVTA